MNIIVAEIANKMVVILQLTVVLSLTDRGSCRVQIEGPNRGSKSGLSDSRQGSESLIDQLGDQNGLGNKTPDSANRDGSQVGAGG